METINDIVREVAAEMLNTSMQEIAAERIHGWATRLGDAATCKESLQVGNTAKSREALLKILGIADHLQWRYAAMPELIAKDILELKQIAEAALAEPLRNCDVGTAEEQDERFDTYCESHINCAHCPLKGRQCLLVWAQMPYETVKTNN